MFGKKNELDRLDKELKHKIGVALQFYKASNISIMPLSTLEDTNDKNLRERLKWIYDMDTQLVRNTSNDIMEDIEYLLFKIAENGGDALAMLRRHLIGFGMGLDNNLVLSHQTRNIEFDSVQKAVAANTETNSRHKTDMIALGKALQNIEQRDETTNIKLDNVDASLTAFKKEVTEFAEETAKEITETKEALDQLIAVINGNIH